ncbi:MAG: porin family protein [Acidobacteriia bacterium]|nr:porin family protein [Terriglobia bacterium]
MRRTLLVATASAFLLCAPSFAQRENPRYEVGFRAGAGAYSYIDNSAYTRAVVGLEACAFCGGRYALFGAYSHFLAPGPPSRYKSADLLHTGLRIQGRRRVSPFFDVGIAAGYSRFLWGAGATRSITTAGVGLGAGVAFRTAKGPYIRPQVRLSIMSEAYLAASAEIAIGWRF